uniref:Uncharacterized protein n=1 Tax=Ditylenchus dipsaci TaxID=166011 RepID=A0A915DLT3_9BILA
MPQMYRNYVRKSTTGMSIKMVLSWLVEIVTARFLRLSQGSSTALHLFQLADCDRSFHLGQVYYYNRETL